MQIGSLNSAADVTGQVRNGNAVQRLTLAGDSGKSATTATAPRSTSQLRRGLSNWDQQLNRELSDAQQAMDFLNRSARQLESLKSDISAKIAGRQVSDAQVNAKLRKFGETWRERYAASGGSLDAQLNYSSPAPASQRFTIRGLDLRSLQAGDREILTFSVSGTGQPPRTVSIEPDMSEDALVQNLSQALSSANIKVDKGEGGAIVFSVPESAWPATRDAIAIKGDGIRFPTGQLNRARTEAVSPAVEPDTWQAQDVQAMRQTLQRVIQALEHIKQSREVVSRALAAAASRVAQAQPPDDGMRAAALAQDFAAATAQPSYQLFSSTVAALLGISRDRVMALLAIGPL